MRLLRGTAVILALLALVGCGDTQESGVPPPEALTRDAVGYFCGMTVVEHSGPKGQIFLSDRPQPLWFTSVRDTLAFTRLPGEPKNIAAIYVNDMGRASWDQPEPGTWIDARTAFYVLNSERVGGMGQGEAVPFADEVAARRFTERYGGTVWTYASIPDDSLLEAAE